MPRVPEDIEPERETSPAHSTTHHWRAIPEDRNGHRGTATSKPFGKEVCSGVLQLRHPISRGNTLHSIDAEHIAEELVNLFARVGVPKEILTDQGSNFRSQLLQEVYRLLHVQPIRTSPYHPQTDGLVERSNQTLKTMLRKTAKEAGKNWDKLLPYVLFAYREVLQTSTGFFPFELLYGRQVRGPLDVLRETWESSSKSNESVVLYVVNMRGYWPSGKGLIRSNGRWER